VAKGVKKKRRGARKPSPLSPPPLSGFSLFPLLIPRRNRRAARTGPFSSPRSSPPPLPLSPLSPGRCIRTEGFRGPSPHRFFFFPFFFMVRRAAQDFRKEMRTLSASFTPSPSFLLMGKREGRRYTITLTATTSALFFFSGPLPSFFLPFPSLAPSSRGRHQ